MIGFHRRNNKRDQCGVFLSSLRGAGGTERLDFFHRRQSAKSWELRAMMSLSRLWQQQGKKAEARKMLAEIYGWFSEGFETKDWQEAKALLEELS